MSEAKNILLIAILALLFFLGFFYSLNRNIKEFEIIIYKDDFETLFFRTDSYSIDTFNCISFQDKRFCEEFIIKEIRK